MTTKFKMTIPHNMKYTIGDDLREVPDDWEAFKKGIIFLEKKLADVGTNLEKAQHLSKLGVLNRIVGYLDISLRQLTDAQLIIRDLGHEKLHIVNEIRLATTLQFQGEFETAEQIHTTLEHQINTNDRHHDLLDFIHQHKGKNYYEWGKLRLALAEFEKALSCRKIKADETLIHSTEMAIQNIKELM